MGECNARQAPRNLSRRLVCELGTGHVACRAQGLQRLLICTGVTIQKKIVEGRHRECVILPRPAPCLQCCLLLIAPQAMHAAFVEVDKQCQHRSKAGTTATLVVQVVTLIQLLRAFSGLYNGGQLMT